MRFRTASLVALVVLVELVIPRTQGFAQEQNVTSSDQQINDFSLAGYGQKGKKAWDLSGKTADIFDQTVKLNDVKGNLYGSQEDVNLTAKKGDFDKVDGKVHLEEDVVITTSTGTKLTTDSLDWDRKKQLVSTRDNVNIQRANMVLEASGAKGEANLKKVALEKDVKLNINPEEDSTSSGLGTKEKIVITCDGPLEIDYDKNIATFSNNVKVDRQDSVIYSDKMDVFFARSQDAAASQSNANAAIGNKIDKIVARGNVKITRGENISYSDEAIYNAADKKITLSGRPKLILYSAEDLKDATSGN